MVERCCESLCLGVLAAYREGSRQSELDGWNMESSNGGKEIIQTIMNTCNSPDLLSILYSIRGTYRRHDLGRRLEDYTPISHPLFGLLCSKQEDIYCNKDARRLLRLGCMFIPRPAVGNRFYQPPHHPPHQPPHQPPPQPLHKPLYEPAFELDQPWWTLVKLLCPILPCRLVMHDPALSCTATTERRGR